MNKNTTICPYNNFFLFELLKEFLISKKSLSK